MRRRSGPAVLLRGTIGFVNGVASAREETAWWVLVVGDRFVPDGYRVDALAWVCGPTLLAGPQPRRAGVGVSGGA